MKQFMDFDYEATLQPDKKFGAKLPDGQWSGMMGSLLRNETDIIGPLFMSHQRASAVPMSNPLSYSQMVIVTGLVPSNQSQFMIFEVLKLEVWLLLFLSFLLVTSTATLIYTLKSYTHQRSVHEVSYKYAWIFYSSLLAQDFGKKNRWYLRDVCWCVSFRTIQGIWLIFISIILMNIYKSKTMSTFATERLVPKIKDLDELTEQVEVGVKAYINSFPAACFQNNKIYDSIWKRMSQGLEVRFDDIRNIPLFFDDIENGRWVFISEKMFMKAVIGERFRQTGKCQLRIMPFIYCAAYIVFAFNKNFPNETRRKFEENLYKFSEGGLPHRSYLHSTLHYDICTQGKSPVATALTLKQLTGAFTLFLAGILISIFTFTVEKFLYCKNDHWLYFDTD